MYSLFRLKRISNALLCAVIITNRDYREGKSRAVHEPSLLLIEADAVAGRNKEVFGDVDGDVAGHG
jgi:hypothetical protein